MNKQNRTMAGRRGFLPVALIALATIAVSACAGQLDFAPSQVGTCVSRRLDIAASMFEEAKDLLGLHFKERRIHPLVTAYYISKEAESLIRTVRTCPGFRYRKREAADLVRANRIFRRVLLINMRDSDPMVMTTILDHRYESIFKNDIR